MLTRRWNILKMSKFSTFNVKMTFILTRIKGKEGNGAWNYAQYEFYALALFCLKQLLLLFRIHPLLVYLVVINDVWLLYSNRKWRIGQRLYYEQLQNVVLNGRHIKDKSAYLSLFWLSKYEILNINVMWFPIHQETQMPKLVKYQLF